MTYTFTGQLEVGVPGLAQAGGTLGVFVLVLYVSAKRGWGNMDAALALDIIEVGMTVQVLPGGQSSIVVRNKGVVGWAPEMSNFRRQVAKVTKIETVLDGQTILRLSADDGKYEWHPNWVRVYK